MHWDDRTTGITDENEENIFDDYQSITETDVSTAKDVRTNDRAIHNAHALSPYR